MSVQYHTPTAVFVYGTLRPSHGNYGWAVAHREHTVTPGRLHGFRLVGAGRGFPYVIPSPGDVTIGDVIEVPAHVWRPLITDLDRLEGRPVHYDRHVVQVDVGDEQVTPAWVYVPVDVERCARFAPVPGGDWTAHVEARVWNREPVR